MRYFRLQLGCMMIIAYIMFIYIKERKRFNQRHRISIFDVLLVLSTICVFLDGLTAYTVNNLEIINSTMNRILHLFFLLSLDSCIFLVFLYMLSITLGIPKTRNKRIFVYLPFLINIILVIVNIPTLKYYKGELSNYSMGVSAYTCFIMAGIYTMLSLGIFFKCWRYIEKHKRISIFTYLFILGGVAVYQMIYPQALLSSIGITIIVLGIYVNQENPSVVELEHYHNEMIVGFATLVENKDGSTGGHIKRTALYVKLLADELRKRGYYKETLTRDYLENLYMAAPMHDIGKIAVPDVILQKPDKLTDEEFENMKLHTIKGGEIIKDTFGHLGDKEYAEMAYYVAKYHHEKWNGKGYPKGLKGEEIPLCARIMAVADVFDAVSQKRCYREAMPLDKCFEIIESGSGKDFEPILVEIFLDIRQQVEEIHKEFIH